MEVVKNKYGMLVYEFKPGDLDMSVTVYDENSNIVIGRDAIRKKRKEIMAEEERLAEENQYDSKRT